ncbi:MAG: hypothetical protein GWN94_18695 [Phycisphaerae bacterium]|nr:hypothetical protein [Phycisphaerae bacterium]
MPKRRWKKVSELDLSRQETAYWICDNPQCRRRVTNPEQIVVSAGMSICIHCAKKK